ncbi:MAG: CBS domain-containing protein [Chloroflexi bacterium]|nr:CBS domain-containing protein [Chloroflexota bacterium]
MLVRERMSRHPITVTPDTSLYDALAIIREEKIRRLPVVDPSGKLVGIVSEKDMLYVSPSPATTLSVYEMNYLIAKIKIKELMTTEVITVEDDCPVEEAARIMADNSISGLPVMRAGTLVGMVTESDLFKVFIELLGARMHGMRVSLRITEGVGVLARLTSALASLNGDIVTLGTFQDDNQDSRIITIKLTGLDEAQIRQVAADLHAEILDIRYI